MWVVAGPERDGVAATPYILTGLAVALGFRGGVFNIGAEGQLYMGALGAVVVGYAVGGLPIWGHLPLALAAGALGGALWGAIPGVLKARFGAHEVINTIMMNYIAIKLVDYLVKQVLRDPTAMDRIRPFCLPPPCRTSLARPRACTRVSSSPSRRSSWSPGCSTRRRLDSRYGPWVSILLPPGTPGCTLPARWCTMALSGMLAGLAGAVEILGLYHTSRHFFDGLRL